MVLAQLPGSGLTSAWKHTRPREYRVSHKAGQLVILKCTWAPFLLQTVFSLPAFTLKWVLYCWHCQLLQQEDRAVVWSRILRDSAEHGAELSYSCTQKASQLWEGQSALFSWNLPPLLPMLRIHSASILKPCVKSIISFKPFPNSKEKKCFCCLPNLCW